MEIRQLQYFIETCKCNSFTQAASNRFISAQGISMSISRLEDELGLKLFTRTKKGVFPTKEGEYLLPIAVQVVKSIGDFEAHFAKSSEEKRSLSIMFSLGTVEQFAHISISQFKTQCHDIAVHIRDGTDTDCENAVMNGEVELALCAGPVNTQNFDAILLHESKNVLVVSDKNPLAKKKTISIAELKNIPLAMRSKTTRSTNTLFVLCEKLGFKPNVFTYVDDMRLAFYLAGLDQCCGISPLSLANKLNIPNLHAVPFNCEEMNWNIFLIKKKKTKLSPEARLFEKTLLKYCGVSQA